MSSRRLYFGDLTLELDRMRLIGPSGPVDLRPKTFDVLRYLVDHARRVVPKNEIIAAVWPDVVVTDESLTHCISEIRRALGSENQSLVRTIQRRGYVFEGQVTTPDDAARQAEIQAVPASVEFGRANGLPERSAPVKKQVTVLHVNCEACLAELSSRDPERALDAHRLILAELTRACDRFGGRVSSVSVYGMTALFGAPSASEDHAVQACQAALEFRAATSRLPAENRSALLGVGLASGEVIVASLAELASVGAMLGIGSASHLARRLSSESNGGVLIDASTQARVLGSFHTKPRAGPVVAAAAHELIGPAAAQTRFQAMAVRGLTPFVGRELELDQLKRAAAVAFGGRGQVAAVIGEPGVGKSRLLYELVHTLPPRDCEILVAGAPSHRAPTSFQVWSNLIKAYLRIAPEDDAAARRLKIEDAVAALRGEPTTDLLACLALIDEVVEDAAWTSLEPPLRRERMLSIGKKLLLNAARLRPLLVVLEDLHWLDPESQEAANSLIDGIGSLPVLVLVSYRPEYAHKWHGRSYYSQIHLDELSDEKRRELLVHLLGKDEQLVDRVGMLHRQGNPLFLEELVRSLADAHILEGRVGAYRLLQPIAPDLRVPAAVQAVLSARIDKLPMRARLVLQSASIVGDTAPVDILRRVVRLPERELEAALAELQAAEFLYEDQYSTERSYRFKHALTRGVAYESLLSDQSAALHRAVFSAIAETYPQRRLEYIEQLAHHALRGEMGMTAVQCAMQAAEKAFARFANREAARFYEDALGALEDVPESQEKQIHAVGIRLRLDHALYFLAEFEKIEVYLHEAERIASTLDDPQHLGWVAAGLSTLYLTGSRGAVEARKQAARAERIAKQCDNRELLVLAQLYSAWSAYEYGDLREAERICRRLMADLRGPRARQRFGPGYPAIRSRNYCARALAEQGRFDEGESLAREALRMAEELDHPNSLSLAYFTLGHVLTFKGDLDEAERAMRPAVEQCLLWRMNAQLPPMRGHLGYVRALRGHVAEGIALLEEAMRDFDRVGIEHLLLSASLVQLGEAYLVAERIEEARSSADRGLDLARRRGGLRFEALALRLLGAVATAQGRHEEAVRYYQDALKSASRINMRPLAALCHLGLQLTYARLGRSEPAEQSRAAADAQLRELGMRVDGRIEAIAIANLAPPQAPGTVALGANLGR